MVRRTRQKQAKVQRAESPKRDYQGQTFSFKAELSGDEKEAKTRFLTYFSEYVNRGKACMMSEVRRDRVEQWLILDPEFKAQYDNIQEQRVDGIEDNVYEMAVDANLPANARLAASKLVLEAERPEKYRRNNDSIGSGEIHVNIILGKKQDKLPPTVDGSVLPPLDENTA